MAGVKWAPPSLFTEEEWGAMIEAAQLERTYTFEGKTYQRIPYDREKRCHDCGVTSGQLHIPGCDMEDCPRCGVQAISWGCGWDDEGYDGPGADFKGHAENSLKEKE